MAPDDPHRLQEVLRFYTTRLGDQKHHEGTARGSSVINHRFGRCCESSCLFHAEPAQNEQGVLYTVCGCLHSVFGGNTTVVIREFVP